MKEIRIGKKIHSIRATPVALFYYHQEFGRCLTDDFLRILYRNQQQDTDIRMLRMVWAMRKAAEGIGKPFLSFEEWKKTVSETELLLENSENLSSIIEEAMNGFLTTCKSNDAEENDSERNSKKKPARLDLELISIGKEIGLSLQEINEFRVQDLIDYVDAKVKMKQKGSETKVRDAKQEDIDMFLS